MGQRILAATLILAVATLTTHALPKFASRLNVSCSACHVNPTGGGLRNLFGAETFGREDLPVPSWQKEYGLENFSTQLNEVLSIGADLRTLYFYQEGSPSAQNSFFQMQTDVYVGAQIAKRTSLYVAKGQGARFEAFGIAGVLPMKGYVKAGLFTPAYGIRMDDHTILVRDRTLFASSAGQDAGMELAISPGIFTFTGAVTNGSAASLDDNNAKALLGRAEARWTVSSFGFQLGGSYYNSAATTTTKTLMGGFAMISYDKNLTLLGEFDRAKTTTSGASTVGNILFLELNYVLVQGLDLKLGYDFFDPDVEQKTGSETRIYAGAEFFPLSGIEVRPLFVYKKEEPTDVKDNQFVLMFHLYL